MANHHRLNASYWSTDMKIRMVIPLFAILVAGCAIVEDPAANQQPLPFMAIEPTNDARTVENGLVTVSEIHQRSDIIVMPPSVQHVIWKRDTIGKRHLSSAVARTPESKRDLPARQRYVRSSWPLLAEDMNFDSAIGMVEMCDRNRPCGPEAGCPPLEPCENPDAFDCFTTKQGNYCLEKQR